MKAKAKSLFAVPAFLLCLMASCHSVGDEQVRVEVERLDEAAVIFGGATVEVRDSLLEQYAPSFAALKMVVGVDVGTFDSLMAVYAVSPAVKVFAPDVQARLSDLDFVEARLGCIRSKIGEEFTDMEFPRHVYGIVTPYNQSVMICDSVMLIGLNHYLGSDYPGYSGFENYRRRVKEAYRIPFDVAEALVATFRPYESLPGATVLSRMLYEGAVVNAVLGMVSDSRLGEVLGYADDEMEWMAANSRDVWDAMVQRGLLYSVDPMDAERLVAPSPSTAVIHVEAPGRLGRYVGYRIVERYKAKHPDVSLSDLLSPEFYHSRASLIESGYDGR